MKIISLNLDNKHIIDIEKYYQSQIELKNFSDIMTVSEALQGKEHGYEVLIVDVNHNQEEKYKLIAEAKRLKIAVIVLSADYEVAIREKYILLGANIVLKTPCSTVELIHSASAVSSCYNSSKLVDNNFTIDLMKRKIWYQDEELAISSQVYDLIVYFIRNAGKVLNREQLLEVVSPYKSNLSSRNIDTLVKTIRKETDSTLIKTVRCSGYIYDSSQI